MIRFRRLLTLLSALVLLCTSSALAAKKKEESFTARDITTDVVEEVPAQIQEVLDLAYQQWQEVDAQNLKQKNKFTEWRGKGYKFGWCGGFVTWCMLQAGVPQEEKNSIKEGEVKGVVHVKEAGVGKLYTGYGRMNRITRVPQKGFIAVYGNEGSGGSTPYYHVGLVYDVEKLSEGKYRITTIEGDVLTSGDSTHKKNAHTVRMFVRDYDMNLASDKKEKKKDMTLVPEDERDREEDALFSYDYAYKKKKMYITIFLMPWIPGEDAE